MQSNETDVDLAVNDLGPLAWVLDELRKSLDTASSALRRFVRDADLARGSDLASVDGGQLRIARQQLHQAVGALEMVGLGAPAHMLRAMESAAQKFVERPELCSEASAAKIERAGFALTEYLEGVLHGKPVAAVALFPQYRDVQELAGADRIHPADLWAMDWRWIDPEMHISQEPLTYDASVRTRMDHGVLKIVKSADAQAAHGLMNICLGLAATQTARQPKIFWKISAAYFEAVSLGLLPSELYVKRAASRILQQYAALAKGEQGVSDRLAQDLLFFCSQAVPLRTTDAPSLSAVRLAWGLARFKPVDYLKAQFGRFDPVLLAQARKRIASAKETWSALSGGDANKLKAVADQFNLVTDSLVKLHPASSSLAQALTQAMDTTVRSGKPPSTELAMEVATAVLYLEAAFEDLDPSDSQLVVRTTRLAERLENVRAGAQPEALESWMEELYRRVSDRQTMGSVVGELRSTLSELEKVLDQFFRDPKEKGPLRDAPTHLSQMRGVLSVLGLDQAAQAVLRMRESVEEILVTEVDEEKARAAGTFDKLGNNLGALGFLIDMLNYQPALAKKLFVYDDALGELKPLMGRAAQTPSDAAASVSVGADSLSQEVQSAVQQAGAGDTENTLSVRLDSIATHAVLNERPALAHSAREAAAAVSAHGAGAALVALDQLAATVAPAPAVPVAAPSESDIEEDDLRDIFLEEAREVVQNGLQALEALANDPGNMADLTTLRRAFHTLKGSSRMVGLTEFGEAAWSMEQLLNAWLADQKPSNEELRSLAKDAMNGFNRWVEDIAQGTDAPWKSGMFRSSADALRTEHRLQPLVLPDGSEPASVPVPVPVETFAEPAELPAEPLSTEVALDLPPELPEVVADPAQAAADPFGFDLGSVELEVAEAAPVPTGELEAAFDFDLGVGAPPAVPGGTTGADMAGEIDGIDFESLSALSAQPPAEPAEAGGLEVSFEAPAEASAPVTSALPGVESQDVPVEFELPQMQTPAAPEPPSVAEVEAEAPVTPVEEQVKVIGSLRIGIPLYNVYLNEADEWSRRLGTEVTEWALELNQPVADSTVGLAHALAGSSATVGFHALSEMARALENALMQAQSQSRGLPEQARAFVAAAEDIRRLLHQFAAGFLKEADAQVLAGLHALKNLDIPAALLETPEPEPAAPAADDDAFDVPDFSMTAALAGAAVTDKPEPVSPAVQPRVTPVETPIVAFTPAPAPATPPVAIQPSAVPPTMPTPVQTLAETPIVAFTPAPAPVTVMASPAEPQAASDRVTLSGEREQEDDIDAVDAVDPDLFPIFEEEANELMPQLGGALRQWAANPGNRPARDDVLRALHTLKGSARLAGALRLGELAHRMESEIEELGSDAAALQPAQLEPLLHRFDGVQANFDALCSTGGLPPAVQPEPEVVRGRPEPMPQAAAQRPDSKPSEEAPSLVRTRPAVAMPVVSAMAPLRPASNQAVRVRSQLLDRLVNQAGEVMITRSRLEAELSQLRGSLSDLSGNLDRLRTQLRDIELQAESQMQSRLAQAKDSAAGFDPLEFDRFTRVQELTRMMAESVNDVATVQRNLQRTVEATEDDLIAQARQTRELQRDLLRTRMVEFESISDRLYRVVRQAGKDTGKQVKLDLTGGSIEMDRGVLDRMTPAFEHLLRNCVAHGIEVAAERVQAGKDASGTILINLHQEGNDVSVEFQDDGAGLNLPRIRDKALQQGLITADQQISDAEAANLIFMPGFSTAAQVTELAGRGIGMDVVRSEVNALGGRIETSTQAGKGTNFKLVLPLTTAVTQVVMLRTGSLSIGVPANVVELVRRATPAELQQAYETGTFEFGGESLPFFWSGALLQSSPRSAEVQARTLPVMIFRSAAQRVAVHVDEVLGNQEVVVKNLGAQLARLPGLAGMTVLASGAVVLIYNPVALSSVYGDQARMISAAQERADNAPKDAEPTPGAGPANVAPVMQAPPQIPLVMVVDDSITVRRVTQRLLQREGYRVSLAADGLQALERLAEELPTVVLSDIEMPRMDGFDLARNIRGDERLKHLPIIMITSRIAEKHREHAMELGVNNYLGKPYSEEELLSLVRHYCGLEVAA
ncbi:MAG: Hpt domain-containing protein [Ramlibacter sp.]|nr:Hpt domain-containing protein [Ramlibacter sp.]